MFTKKTPFLLLLQAFLYLFSSSNASSAREPVSLNSTDRVDSGTVIRGIRPDGGELKRFIISVQFPDGLGSQLTDKKEQQKWYKSLLYPFTNPLGASKVGAEPRLLHSYTSVLAGFSAQLTDDELNALSKSDWFVKAIPDPLYKLHTTRTPEFLGLHPDRGLWNDSRQGEGVIVGVLDSGIFADHPSFSDSGMPPPPKKWNGSCDFDAPLCNNKLIGAQSFLAGEHRDAAPVDEGGHGTHTASTAAGSSVDNASALGNAAGTTIGMAPRAHLAIYRVCSGEGCFGSDIMAGMDAAINDNVDIISLSLGGGGSKTFYEDLMASLSFPAISKGILVSASAGNEGPKPATLSNDAPWILTVGASTIDRKIIAAVKLGNGAEFQGQSLNYPNDSEPVMLPLVFPGANGNEETACCISGSLNGVDVRGKAVVCQRGIIGRMEKGKTVKEAGGAAMILINTDTEGYTTMADAHVLPASHVVYQDGLKILAYINSTEKPTAGISFRGTVIGTPFAPSMADFSSRGPSRPSPGLLKPDITGPGVSIMAAGRVSPDTKRPTFTFMSGTSMSCPHVSGIAALIKSVHPDWSPAAIKSAIMTTADLTDRSRGPITNERHSAADIYAVGAGHVNPERAKDPGLVYDLTPEDYIPYLCGLGYGARDIRSIIKRMVDCSEVGSIKERELNYPSIAVEIEGDETVVLERKVRNVGKGTESYEVKIEGLKGVEVGVEPKKLRFLKENEEKRFKVAFSRNGEGKDSTLGYLKWVSPSHVVRSPILVTFK